MVLKRLIEQTCMTWPDAMSIISKNHNLKKSLSFCRHVADKNGRCVISVTISALL